MTEKMLVGEFSRLTHLTTKALHHYHRLGLLEPACTDPATGYRYYGPEQVDRAHLVRRLRAARMPLAQVRATLAATGAERERHLLDHLDALRSELLGTAAAVTSLSALLGRAEPVVHRGALPARRCLVTRTGVGPAGLADWCAVAYPRLGEAARALGLHPQGPYGATYEASWFSGDGGTVTAFLPVAGTPAGAGPGEFSEFREFSEFEEFEEFEELRGPGGSEGVGLVDLPGGTYASAVHEGPCSELDLTYGHLGRHVLARGDGGPGPVREHYLVSSADTPDPRALRTEVCWPVSAA